METPKEIIISAPGKVILHGEHSVVYGKVAVAAGVNLRAFLRLRCSSMPEVRLHLPDVGIDRTFSVADLTALFTRQLGDPLTPAPITEELLERFKTFCEVSSDNSDTAHLAVIAFLYLYGSIAWTGGSLVPVDVTLASTQPVGAGLGSSASFSVCLATALLSATGVISPCQRDNGDVPHRSWSVEDKKLINGWGFEGERIIHGKPSGIDNSMATYGGALKFQSGKIEQLDAMPRLRILLTNTKVPRSTKVLVAGVREKYNRLPEVFGPVFEAMDGVSQRGIDTYTKMADSPSEGHYHILKDLIDVNQGLLRLIGVSHPQLETIVTRSGARGVHSKLTGAGGGGCALSLITPDTPESVIGDLKREFTELGFGCWETIVGGEGVLIHDSLDTPFTLPATFQQS